MNIIRNIKGTHDILPPETKKWQNLEKIIRQSSEQFGFEEIRTPMFEQTKLFSRSVGSNSDIVSKEMYSWDDRDGTSLTLRPELTASIARSFIQNNLKARSPLNKLYYMGPLFRRERPQKGRQRQFHQFGVEALGSEFPEMDAEIISIAWTIILKCQLNGSTSLQLNSIGSSECRERYRDALKNFVRPHLKDFSETSQKRFSENALRLLDSKSNKEQLILNDAPKISEYYTKNDKSHFEKVKELLQTLKIPFSINSKLVRGLDYYSRTVFEFTSSSLGAQNAILGGGRYDTLIKDLGGKETPGIGFAAGMERFLIAMKEEEDNNSKIDVYVACILEEGLQKALHLSNELRKIGMRVTSDPLRRSLKAQMRDANKLESKYIIIIGKEELESEVFIVKNLNKGDQEVLTYSELIELFKKVII